MAYVMFVLILLLGAWLLVGIVLPLARTAGEDCCPSCKHSAKGLVHPRCPECGADLSGGIQRAGAMTEFWRVWLGVNVIVGGSVFGVLFGLWILLSELWSALTSALGGMGPTSEEVLFSVGVGVCFMLVLMSGAIVLGVRVITSSSRKPFPSSGRGLEA